MSSRIWIGLLFVLIGVGFLLQQIAGFNFSSFMSIWWPLILVYIGLVLIIEKKYRSWLTGMLFIFIGGIILANQWVEVNLIVYIWPIIIIFIGLVFIFSRSNHGQSSDMEEDFHSVAIFSGATVRNQSQNFQSGSALAVLGGIEIDLRDIVISEEGALIDITAILGGVNIVVPENVHVEIKGIPILGGFEDGTRRRAEHDGPTLTINCLAVLGGVEVKD